MKTYLLTKLVWNPDYDLKRGIEQFDHAWNNRAEALARSFIF